MKVKIKDIAEGDAFYSDRNILIGRIGEVDEKYFTDEKKHRASHPPYIFCHIKMDDSIETIDSWPLCHSGDKMMTGRAYSFCFAGVLFEDASFTIDKELFKID
jgi:hypothetical protein